MRVIMALATLAALAACTPTGGGGSADTPVSRSEARFPGPDAQSRHRPVELPAGG
ncbi:hypothetical protein [Rhodovulum sp. 12E13]|uniref:hypothetical protein n=1 Tax=Rhodovulum sp. 12E13 TaxID=2203891 RepID=UPI00131501FC|nr:hypothetical protein [Rhodovulum sp. 12E13]